MGEHKLKTDPAVYDAVRTGVKTFEIRFDDRGYQAGDILILCKTRYTGAEMVAGAMLDYVDGKITCEVKYILRGPIYGLANGWCIMSIEVKNIATNEEVKRNG